MFRLDQLAPLFQEVAHFGPHDAGDGVAAEQVHQLGEAHVQQRHVVAHGQQFGIGQRLVIAGGQAVGQVFRVATGFECCRRRTG